MMNHTRLCSYLTLVMLAVCGFACMMYGIRLIPCLLATVFVQ